jgi:Trypsin-co-occurring domain 2
VVEDMPTLGELIAQLRRELDAAQRDDPGNPIRFRVGPVELETTLAVTKGSEAGAGVVLKVLSLGAKRSTGDAETTRLKLVLTPIDRRTPNADLTVSAEDTEGDASGGGAGAGD